MTDLRTPAVAALTPRRIGSRTFDFARRTAVMAVVNRTPDSFSDGGATYALDAAFSRAQQAIAEGADWIDIGGMPFSPDTPEVSVEDELARVLPLLRQIRSVSDVVLSVDTFRPEVADACLAAGADVINDVTGLAVPGMAQVVAVHDATVVIAHSVARPHRHLRSPSYTDVVTEVVEHLCRRVDVATEAGVAIDRIVIDPGHDLNKNTRHSLLLTRRLDQVAAIGLPLLVALSNKDFIGETLDRPQGQRLAGSLAAAVLCVRAGARILRVHQVRETVDAVRMTEAIMGLREPAYLRHNIDNGTDGGGDV
ncbi:MAG: dihydropteroate synthase [Beutenbergiaceae bacterium]